MKTVQDCGVDASTKELNVKSVNTHPILGGVTMHGMKSNEIGSNAEIVAQSVATKHVVDHVLVVKILTCLAIPISKKKFPTMLTGIILVLLTSS